MKTFPTNFKSLFEITVSINQEFTAQCKATEEVEGKEYIAEAYVNEGSAQYKSIFAADIDEALSIALDMFVSCDIIQVSNADDADEYKVINLAC